MRDVLKDLKIARVQFVTFKTSRIHHFGNLRKTSAESTLKSRVIGSSTEYNLGLTLLLSSNQISCNFVEFNN